MARFALLGAVVLGLVLASAASAFAATTEVYVYAYDTALGRPADTELDVVLPASGPATASIVFYAPQGYGVTPSQAGTKVGTAIATVTVGGSTTKVQAAGDLIAGDPSQYFGNTCAPGLHAAVVVANLTASGITVPVPLYIDPTTGAEATLGAFRIQACLAPPDVPAALGGAPAGLRVLEADLDFVHLFTNPSAPGTYTWRVLNTPFVPTTVAADPTATVEARALVGLPKLFSLKWALSAAKTSVSLSGKLVEGGKPRARVNVNFRGGPQNSYRTWKPFGVAQTKADGSFSFTRAIATSVYLYAFVNPYVGDYCTVPGSPAPRGCVFESIGASYGPVIHIVVPKIKKKK